MQLRKPSTSRIAAGSAAKPQELSQRRFSDLDFAAPYTLGMEAVSPVKSIRTIVVPLDGTSLAEHALPPALAIARRCGATMRIIHAWSRLDSITPWQMTRAHEQIKPTEREKQNYLSGIVEKVTRTDHVRVESSLLDSIDIQNALVHGASGGDLVVLASRRRSLASRLWWNSMVDVLRRKLTIPLLVARGEASSVNWNTDPIARNILVPLDGSILAESILPQVANLARLEGAWITLLNVQNEEGTRGFFEHTTPRDYLLTAMRKLQLSGTIAETRLITTSRGVAESIASFAEQSGTDLIALATRADGGLSRVMRGSVADTLLRRTNVPMLMQSFDGKQPWEGAPRAD